MKHEIRLSYFIQLRENSNIHRPKMDHFLFSDFHFLNTELSHYIKVAMKCLTVIDAFCTGNLRISTSMKA